MSRTLRTQLLSLALFALLAAGRSEGQALVPPPDPGPKCGELRFGLGYLDRDALRWGRWRGQQRGPFGLLSGQACRLRSPAPDGARWWVLRIDELGLHNRSVQIAGGEQGRWQAEAGQRRLHTPLSTGFTPLAGLGTGRLELPSGWVAGPSTAAMSGLRLPDLPEVGIGSARRISHVGLGLWLPGDWRWQSQLREQRRSGLTRFAGMVGSTGGNARAIILPAPVDQRTRELETALVHGGERLGLRIGWLISRFDNGHDRIVWQNPFAGVAGWAPSASHPSGFGQAALAPDNRALQLSASASWQASPSWTLGADLAFGQLRQDQALLPYTINPVLAAGITQPLPRASLDGRVDTRLLQLRLTGRPHPHWRWNLNLRHDQRDDRTPMAEWVYVPGDAVAQNPAPTSGTRRYNLPYDWRDNRLRAELGYRPSRRMDLSARLDYSEIRRTFSARASAEEAGIELAWRSQLDGGLGLGLRAGLSDRSGGSYIGNRAFLASHAPGYTDTVFGQFENLPGLRQYHLADRRRERLRGFVQYAAHPRLGLMLDAGHTRDDYRRSELGLTDSRIRDLGFEISSALDDSWTVWGWARWERLEIAQTGRAFMGGTARPGQSVDPNRNWFLDHRDRVESHGLSLERRGSQGQPDLRLDLSESDARGRIALATGPALSSGPLPPSRARLRQSELRLDWTLDTASSLLLGYRHERFRSRDWAWDGTAPHTLATVILLGERSPNYSGNALTLGYRRRF